MSSSFSVNRFKGTDWEECNEFVLAIRAAAWKGGKIRDLAWMADFASLHFSHEALLSQSQPPRDVRQDWEKLEAALLNRWAPAKHEDEPRIEPTPAAAPSLGRSDRADHPLHGALKVVLDGLNTSYYLKLDGDGCGMVTQDANKALRIRSYSLANTTLLERTDGSRHSWLGVQWENEFTTTSPTEYGFLVLVDLLSLKTSWQPGKLYQLALCTVSENQEVNLFWEDDDLTKTTIGIFYRSDTRLFLTANPEGYSKFYASEIRARIFIEEMDY